MYTYELKYTDEKQTEDPKSSNELSVWISLFQPKGFVLDPGSRNSMHGHLTLGPQSG